MPLSRGQAHNTAQHAVITILTSDPDKRVLEGTLRDGGKVSVSVWGSGATFRWPKIGEVWTIKRQGNVWWQLGDRIRYESERSLESMDVGELRLDSDYITDVNGVGLPPVGSVILWAGLSVPEGYLFCTGQTVDIAAYPRLYEQLQNKHGPVTATTFTLPNIPDLGSLRYIIKT
jgi:hypothetical protein